MHKFILLLSFSYLLGSIPSGFWLSKYFYNNEVPIVDGQMGTKYMWKKVGLKASVYTFSMDFLKGYIPLFTTIQLMPRTYWLQTVVIIGVVLGHNYSIFLNFKGGKGIAAAFGCFAIFPTFLPLLILCHYLANELCKKRTLYGLAPLLILAITALDPLSKFTHIPFAMKIAACLTIFLFIIKTYDDPMYLKFRQNYLDDMTLIHK